MKGACQIRLFANRRLMSCLHRVNLRRFRLRKAKRVVVHVPKTAGSFVKLNFLSKDKTLLHWGHRSVRDSPRLVGRLSHETGSPVVVAGLREPFAWYCSLFNDHFYEDFVAPYCVRGEDGELDLCRSTLQVFAESQTRPRLPPRGAFFSARLVSSPEPFLQRTSLGLYTWTLLHLLGKESPHRIDNTSLLDNITWLAQHTSFYRVENIQEDCLRIFGRSDFDPSPIRKKKYDRPSVPESSLGLRVEQSIYAFLCGDLSSAELRAELAQVGQFKNPSD